jgi:hypothetical protein
VGVHADDGGREGRGEHAGLQPGARVGEPCAGLRTL